MFRWLILFNSLLIAFLGRKKKINKLHLFPVLEKRRKSHRLTNNSIFFFSTLQSGFGVRISAFLWPSWEFWSPGSCGWPSTLCRFPLPVEEEESERGLGTAGEGGGFWWLTLCLGGESSCSGGNEADPSWRPSFWLCSSRAFSRWSCCLVFFTGRRRWGSNRSR